MAYTHLNQSNFSELRFMQVYLKSLNMSDCQENKTKHNTDVSKTNSNLITNGNTSVQPWSQT